MKVVRGGVREGALLELSRASRGGLSTSSSSSSGPRTNTTPFFHLRRGRDDRVESAVAADGHAAPRERADELVPVLPLAFLAELLTHLELELARRCERLDGLHTAHGGARQDRLELEAGEQRDQGIRVAAPPFVERPHHGRRLPTPPDRRRMRA